MDKLKDLMARRLSAHKLSSEASASQVVSYADDFLKKTLNLTSSDIKVLYLKNAILWIGVSHPILGQEILGVLDPLLSDLQKKYGQKMIQKIRTKSLTIE